MSPKCTTLTAPFNINGGAVLIEQLITANFGPDYELAAVHPWFILSLRGSSIHPWIAAMARGFGIEGPFQSFQGFIALDYA